MFDPAKELLVIVLRCFFVFFENEKWPRNAFPEPGFRRELRKIVLLDEARPATATPGPGEAKDNPKIAPDSFGKKMSFKNSLAITQF